jgi:hypothetical protein
MADKTMRNTPYKRSKYADFKTLTSELVDFSSKTIPFSSIPVKIGKATKRV